MNTPIRRMHENHFKLRKEKLKKATGKTWMKPSTGRILRADPYYYAKKHLVFVEAIVGRYRAAQEPAGVISCMPIPFMEVEAAWRGSSHSRRRST